MNIGKTVFSQVIDFLPMHEFCIDLDQTVYALDSTTIDLCLSLFPWAKFRKYKGAIKLHTLMDLRGSILRLSKLQTVRFMI